MKKTLIASAVALAMSSAGVSAQEVKLPKIYGNIQLATVYSNAEDDQGRDEDYSFVDNESTLGFTHEHEVMPGVTAFFKAEFEFDAVNGDAFTRTDEAYIGLKGDFGTIWGGRDDSVYEWVDVTDLYELLSVPTEVENTGENRLIQYTTPSFGGLTLGAALQINGRGENGNPNDAFQLAAQYEIGNTSIALAFDSGERAFENSNSYGLGITHRMNDLVLAAQYEHQEDAVDVFGVLGAYTMGQTVLMASYHFSDYDVSGSDFDDTHTISLQALHNLSSNFYVYVEAQWTDNATRAYDVDGDNVPDVLIGTKGAEDHLLALGATYVF